MDGYISQLLARVFGRWRLRTGSLSENQVNVLIAVMTTGCGCLTKKERKKRKEKGGKEEK